MICSLRSHYRNHHSPCARRFQLSQRCCPFVVALYFRVNRLRERNLHTHLRSAPKTAPQSRCVWFMCESTRCVCANVCVLRGNLWSLLTHCTHTQRQQLPGRCGRHLRRGRLHFYTRESAQCRLARENVPAHEAGKHRKPHPFHLFSHIRFGKCSRLCAHLLCDPVVR